jgi:UDP-N-acetylmuramyl pentapeptide phosphotransferase/UDP-N-acetylglucosamine-1-phosphate transferase
MVYIITTIFLFSLELVYFRVARRYKILDIPNQRSSHVGAVVRGGGIIFPISALAQELYLGFPHPYFMAGLVIVAAVSFFDDIVPLPNRVRILAQFLAVTLMFLDTSMVAAPWWKVFTIAILTTGFLNAFNFMDGINGITGAYGLVTILCLAYVNDFVHPFIQKELALFVLIGLLVFNYFNFRVKAQCFAGDVGSISLPFIIAFFLLKLYISLEQFSPILLLFLAVYGVDSVNTILKRLLKRENIFEAHRSHLYQNLVHRMKFSHLQVSAIYGFLQLGINVGAIYFLSENSDFQLIITAATLLSMSAIYWIIAKKL